MPKIKNPQYVVHCGDADLYFQHGRRIQESNLQRIFKKRVGPFEVFPGLVLRDVKGKLWRPELRVELIPIPEDSDG